MAVLGTPITKQNMVDRFADYVTATANSGIVWGTNAYPFAEWTDTGIFGGDTGGIGISINGTNIQANANAEIYAQSIYDVLIAESAIYTRIRNMRAVLFVDGAGGNTGSRPTAGVVFDQTSKTNMNTNYLQGALSAARDDVVSGNVITAAGLEVMFSNMRTAYTDKVGNVGADIQVNVCHASCHSSCHGSRGRR